MKIRVDLGCEMKKKPGYLGIYINPFDCVDLVADLTKSFPFKDNSIDEFYSNQFIEHLEKKDFIFYMNEIWRTGKLGARIVLIAPYETFVGAEIPVHYMKCNTRTFCVFEEYRHYHGVYTHAKFRINKIILWFNKQGVMGPINNIVEKFANRFPEFYELNLKYIFPAHRITYEMEVIK